MAINSITLQAFMTVVETGVLAAGFPASQTRNITHSEFNQSQSLGASSTPAVTKIAFFDQALTAGAATIDLTALAHNAGVVDGSGLKVQGMLFVNPAGNSAVTITDGASNGYNLFGDASGQVTVPAHATVDSFLLFFFPEGLQDIGGSDKTIDLAGTGTETFQIGLLLG